MLVGVFGKQTVQRSAISISPMLQDVAWEPGYILGYGCPILTSASIAAWQATVKVVQLATPEGRGDSSERGHSDVLMVVLDVLTEAAACQSDGQTAQSNTVHRAHE